MNVLLIGDSIRIYYEDEVRMKLGDAYEVYGPDENCRFSSYVLYNLRFWLAKYPTPDIIHFNAGLWDTSIIYKEDGCFNSIEQYVSTMKKVLRVLKNTGAKVIFATTTPVRDEKSQLPGPIPPIHKNEDIMRYNAALLEAFKDEDIYINDLFSLVYDERDKYICDDFIHPNKDGIKLLGNAVAQAIRNCDAIEKSHHDEKVEEIEFCVETMH